MYKDRLKELREEKWIKQKDVAKMLGISKTTYNMYENEYTTIPIKYLNEICNYFNVSIDYILGFSNSLSYPNSRKEIDLKLSGKRLKELRKSKTLSQVQMAKILNMGNGTIANYELGKYVIPTSFLYMICKKYDIRADYLLGKVE